MSTINIEQFEKIVEFNIDNNIKCIGVVSNNEIEIIKKNGSDK